MVLINKLQNVNGSSKTNNSSSINKVANKQNTAMTKITMISVMTDCSLLFSVFPSVSIFHPAFLWLLFVTKPPVTGTRPVKSVS